MAKGEKEDWIDQRKCYSSIVEIEPDVHFITWALIKKDSKLQRFQSATLAYIQDCKSGILGQSKKNFLQNLAN